MPGQIFRHKSSHIFTSVSIGTRELGGVANGC